MQTEQRKLDDRLIALAVAWLRAENPDPPKLPKLRRAIDIPLLEGVEAVRQAAIARGQKA